jgi:GDP-L-fucose synthase
MKKKNKVFITGHKGLLGSSIFKELKKKKNTKILTVDRKNLDLENYQKLEKWFKNNKPDFVINAAAKAGGIEDNDKYPVDYMIINIKIQTNLIDLSHKYKVKKFLFIGSSCIYPKFSKVPIKETELLKGELEPTNQWYALTKIHGVKLCEALNKQYGLNYSCVMPTNLFGPNDKYDERSHVIPALIKRMHFAKVNNKKYVKVWGDGRPKREFLYVNDCAKIICKFLFDKKYYKLVNIGTGKDISIKQLAEIIKKVVGFNGKIKFDKKMPNGVMRKTLDISKIKKLRLNNFTDFQNAMKLTYNDFLKRI